MFSRRLPHDLAPNRLARARAAVGEPRADLTVSNPTRCGFDYPADLLDGLADARGLDYRPEPLGLPEARATVAALYRERGGSIDPAQVALTGSSSEAYALLFKLLADPGDAVLLPAPSYPLLEHLATLEGLVPRVYHLDPHDGWQPDPKALRLGGARALVSVHPNNPTGSFLDRATMEAIEARCAVEAAAWIVDEVFLDYALGDRPAVTTAGRETALTFTLGGLSKSVGLPQLKLGWIVVGGPPGAVDEALARLAFIADNYLSVATPVQLALSGLLTRGRVVRDAILARCRQNLDRLRQACGAVPGVALIEPAGGWSAVVRYPHVVDEETLAVELLLRHGVAVHPGFLFDFAEPGLVVVSLLPQPPVFDEGVALLLERVAEHLRGA